jgi:saxitoxin biosynthesis operon SxtJ-like protein
MRWSDVTKTPTDRQLRQFAAIAAILLAAPVIWQLATRGSLVVIGCYAASAVIAAAIGLVRPRWLAPSFTFWMIAAFPLAWLVSNLVLAVIFFGVLTPLGLLLRLLGRDPLDRAWPARQDSYWQERPASDKPERYLRQF